MEQINIYEGEQVISRILVQDGVEGLEACLENYEHVYAVMDENVAMKCPAAYEVSQMLNRRGVPGMLVEVSEETKCIDTVMDTQVSVKSDKRQRRCISDNASGCRPHLPCNPGCRCCC